MTVRFRRRASQYNPVNSVYTPSAAASGCHAVGMYTAMKRRRRSLIFTSTEHTLSETALNDWKPLAQRLCKITATPLLPLLPPEPRNRWPAIVQVSSLVSRQVSFNATTSHRTVVNSANTWDSRSSCNREVTFFNNKVNLTSCNSPERKAATSWSANKVESDWTNSVNASTSWLTKIDELSCMPALCSRLARTHGACHSSILSKVACITAASPSIVILSSLAFH